MDSAEKENTEEGLFMFYDSFTELFEFFCDNTTIHGTVRLNCSRRNKMKTGFWVFLYLFAFSTMYFQFGDTFTQYWSYPTNLAIHLQTKKSNFPAVTICNMNPYRFDQVNEYLNQLDQLAQETLQTLYGYNASLSVNNDVVDLQDITDNATSQLDEKFQLDSSIKLIKLEDDPNQMSKGNRSKLGFKLCDSTGGDCYYRSFWSGVDALHEWYQFHFINIMHKIPSVLQIADQEYVDKFILKCDFNGHSCNRNYTHFHHPTYGTCFTINGNENSSALWAAVKPEKKYGISLIVKVDQHDNMPILSTTAGTTVMIHNPNQSPLVEHQGFDIWPGTETSISVRQDQVNRLEKPYSNCTYNGAELDFTLLYNSSYTLQACVQSCFQYIMIEQCGCGYYFYPLPSGSEYCNYNKHPGWGHCFFRLYEKLLDHQHTCFKKCPIQCTETMYYLSAGFARWPSTVSKSLFLTQLSSDYGYNSTVNRTEFSKINVYFQELNLQSFDETPAISSHDLLSTMGNQWSFYFGSSVLSVVEIAELVFDVVAMVIIINYAKRKKKQVTNNNEGPYVIRMEGLSGLDGKTLPNSSLNDQDLPSYRSCDTKSEEI
ncbi:PREDICTED: amiloride-sensitive sodium channel subunit delta [Nanorana parkeri]|uniref:amiloride-sensitive sodium channel subunit delta n=1 Tax=Nanorana parkeri TaxID=125878 RepID=UPI000854D99E|nr:PREDICTED: amiloride-sensitive sodium channel subunit delta [Nanorana parkeri]